MMPDNQDGEFGRDLMALGWALYWWCLARWAEQYLIRTRGPAAVRR